MPPILQEVTGSNAGKKHELGKDKIRLGRHPDCEVLIDRSAVSRFHAEMHRDGPGYLIEDLGSRNGTYINGKRIEGKVPLGNNDRVKICDVLFVYQDSPTSRAGLPIFAETEDTPSTVINTIDAKSSVEILGKVNADVKLKAVVEISQAIAQIFDLDKLFPRILDSLFKIFPQADRALIILRDENDQLIPRAVKHRRADEDTVRFSRTVVKQAMEERQAILSADAGNDERFAMSQSIADFRIRSIMCVPLLTQDQKALGVIQLDTQSLHQRFAIEDLQLLTAVGTQASIAVENAQLHENILDQQRMERELAFAKDVQAGFLPRKKPKVPGYLFWAYYEAAGQVGGDYYDFIKLQDGRQVTILGDVSGKGIPAALLMAKVSSDAKVAFLSSPNSPSEAVGNINNALCDAGLEGKFMTMALCVIEPKAHHLTIVNAGHMSPIIRRSDGSLEEPADRAATGLPLGVLENIPYASVQVNLGPGDVVVLFSDGISEAMNAGQEIYSIERLHKRIAKEHLPPARMGESILRDVNAHVGGYRQSDDITLVVFGRVPSDVSVWGTSLAGEGATQMELTISDDSSDTLDQIPQGR